MASILLVLGALLLLRLPWTHRYWLLAVSLAAILAAVVAGLTLPDIDQPLPLDHRSAVSHSILPALLASVRRWAWPVAAGLALGLSLHLAADVFPDAMIGFATVKMPFAGSIGGDASYVWLIVNALACTALGGWLVAELVVHRTTRLLLFGIVALIGAAYLLTVAGGWAALSIYLAAAWVAVGRSGARRRLIRPPVRATGAS